MHDSTQSGQAAVLTRAKTSEWTSAVQVAWHLLRCDEWLKNVFVFAGLLFIGPPFVTEQLGQAALGFALFSAVASAVYIHNDIVDRESDLQHPVKRNRPIAAGRVSPGVARVIQLLLLAVGFAGAMVLPDRFPRLLASYVVLNFVYTAALKKMVILDVMALAAGFVLRVEAGCAAIGAEASSWLVLCTFLLALLMGFGKRRHELLLAGAVTQDHRAVLERYSRALLDQMIGIASGCTIVGYAIFTTSWRTVSVHGTANLVYTVPFVVYGIFRYQLLIFRGGGGDPTELVLGDFPLLVTIVLWLVACVGILYWN
jgi:4-hydroxybenzoate polyprenyltransferase